MAGERSADREPLLERQQGDNEASSSAQPAEPVPRRQLPAQSEEDAENALFELRAHKVVTWTVWFLLAAVLIGTVIGVVLVSLSMQKGDGPPAVRKSAALIILRRQAENCAWDQCPENERSNRLSRYIKELSSDDAHPTNSPRAIVWSGKGRGKRPVYNDLHSFDLSTKLWTTIFNLSAHEGQGLHYPAPRWKALTVFEPRSRDMVVFGGDPLVANGEFLNDLWRLKPSASDEVPSWQRIEALNASEDESEAPGARRAHAGVILDVNGSSNLVIHGGKQTGGALLSDLWSTSLGANSARWERRSSGADESPENKEVGKKGRKRKKHFYPLARKGHAAFALPDPHRPKMVIWGGRNDTAYFQDMWAFDLSTNSWEKWDSNPDLPRPSARDHLGGFYHSGSIYIYGGRGGTSHDDSVPLGDMWKFNISSQRWSEIKLEGERPLPRFLYGSDTYTAKSFQQDQRMLIFGGESAEHCYLNDIWEFSLSSRQWRQLSEPQFDKQKCFKLSA